MNTGTTDPLWNIIMMKLHCDIFPRNFKRFATHDFHGHSRSFTFGHISQIGG
ncbi:hypothetical protein D3C80_2091330 [compost metagenome]